MDTTLPSTDFLKSQAKRLRVDLTNLGYPVTHATTLEMVAHQWGARDWNTLSAKAGAPKQGWAPGDRVSGCCKSGKNLRAWHVVDHLAL